MMEFGIRNSQNQNIRYLRFLLCVSFSSLLYLKNINNTLFLEVWHAKWCRACSAVLKNKPKYCSSWLLWEKNTVLAEITVYVNSDSWGGCPASQPPASQPNSPKHGHHHITRYLLAQCSIMNGFPLHTKSM